MNQATAATLEEAGADLKRGLPWSDAVLEAGHRSGFKPTHIAPASKTTWFVRVATPPKLQDAYGLAPELLIILIRGAVQARDLFAAQGAVVGSGLRLDGNIVVVADDGPGPLAERLKRIPGSGQRIAWARRGDVWPDLPDILREQLPTFDAYEQRDAVRGTDLVGRQSETAALRTRVSRGDAVGLFGLRKVGKTSLMRGLTDWWDPASGLEQAADGPTAGGSGIAVVVDAGTVIERTADALAGELLRALNRRQVVAGARPFLAPDSGLVAWKAAGEAVLDGGNPLCVVIDEYDLLFEGEGGEGAFSGLGTFFRLLRGWAQTRQGRLSLLLIGRDPSYLANPQLDGVTSPLAAWFTPFWIGPLSRDKSTELLRKLGSRIGISVGPRTADLAFELTGGHPLLHRQYGSALRSVIREQSSAWSVPSDPFAEPAAAAFRERGAVDEVMREVRDLLMKRYPGAYDVLHALSVGAAPAGPLAADGRELRVLKNFGLVGPNERPPAVLSEYVCRTAGPQVAARRAS